MGRSPMAWRRRLVKKMKHKALKFQNEASSIEEILAWGKVITWLESILGNSEMRWRGDLGLRELSDEEIEETLDS